MKRSIVRLFGAALVAVLAWTGVASASDIDITAVVDVDSPTGSVSLARGDTGAITINGALSGNQAGTTTFKVYKTWTLQNGEFTGSDPQTFTFGPQSGGANNPFSTVGEVVVDCDETAPSGPHTLTIEAFDVTNTNSTGAKAQARDSATYSVSVSSAAKDASCPSSQNQAPTVSTAAADADGDEGDTLSASGAFTDADADSLTLTADNTEGDFVDNGDGTWSWSLTTTDDVAGGTITVTADDGNGGTVTDQFDYSASNVDPVVTIDSLAKTSGCGVELDFSWTDAGTGDTHSAVIDWGDDSDDATFGDPASSPVTDQAHTYPGTGTYTATVTVTDDDGGDDDATGSTTFSNVTSQILDPLRNDANYKIGSSLPVKITVVDCANRAVTNLTPTVSLTKLSAQVDGDPTLPAETTAAPTNGKTMLWNGEQYIYVLSTKNSQFVSGGGALTQGAYRLTVSGDGITSRTVNFELRK